MNAFDRSGEPKLAKVVPSGFGVAVFMVLLICVVSRMLVAHRPWRVFVNLPVANEAAKRCSTVGSFVVNLKSDGSLSVGSGDAVEEIAVIERKLADYQAHILERRGRGAYVLLRADRLCKVGDVRRVYDMAVRAGCRRMRFAVYQSS